MRYLLLPLLGVVLAGCQTAAVPFEPVSDPCKSLQYLSLVGMKEDGVDRGSLPDSARFVRGDTVPTGDHQAERLNVHVNAQGRIVRFSCG